MFQIITKQVHGPRGIEPAYDVEFNGKFVGRYYKRAEAKQELATMQRYAARHGLGG